MLHSVTSRNFKTSKKKKKNIVYFDEINLLLCLFKHHTRKTYEEMEVQVHAFSAQLWMEVSGLFHALICTWGKSLWFPLGRKLAARTMNMRKPLDSAPGTEL
jgi:hypothetical protein